MTKSEISRRLSTMNAELLVQVERMVVAGYGAQGITQNSMATLKQANAVFAARQIGQTVAGFNTRRALDTQETAYNRKVAALSRTMGSERTQEISDTLDAILAKEY